MDIVDRTATHTHRCPADTVKGTARAPATARELDTARVAMGRMLRLTERASLGMVKVAVGGTAWEKGDRIEMRVASKS